VNRMLDPVHGTPLDLSRAHMASRGGDRLWNPSGVESDALNFFLPFRRLEPNHETQLTRALLVVLRYSPMAHAAWLRLVASWPGSRSLFI
jgi:hypothetical protein